MDRLWVFSETGRVFVVPNGHSIVDEEGNPHGSAEAFALDVSNKNEFSSCCGRADEVILVSGQDLFDPDYLAAIPTDLSRLALIRPETPPAAREQLNSMQLDGLVFAPFTEEAVDSNIKKAFDDKQSLIAIKNELKNYSSIAFTAMSSASEMGVVAFYAQSIQNTLTFERLAEQTLRALHDLSVQGFVQFSFDSTITIYPQNITDNYRELFFSIRESDRRIVSHGRFLIFNFENVQILVTDAPQGDPDKYGRLRDVIAHIASISESRAKTIKLNLVLKEHQDNTRRFMQLMEMASRDNRNSVKEIMTNLSLALRELATGMDLNLEQESALLNLSERALESLEALHEATDAVEDHFRSLLLQLDQAERLLKTDEIDEMASQEASVELF